jgi:hypothetical protein
MSRLSAVLGFVISFAPAVVLAQAGQGPPTPMAVDLAKVPIGVWAEYSMTVGTIPPMKTRMALVGKGSATNTIEMTVEGGMMAMAGGKMIMQSTIDADPNKDKPLKKVIMQIGANDPMEMPVDAASQQQFRKPDPKKLVKEETIKVAAGSFKTKHYRDKTAQGDAFDFWVSESVPPFGIVKIEGQQKSSPGPAAGPLKLELTAVGKNARSAVTKPAKPFDQETFMKQIMGGAAAAGGGAPAGGPPPAATASSKNKKK